jgi:hypothetical protein
MCKLYFILLGGIYMNLIKKIRFALFVLIICSLFLTHLAASFATENSTTKPITLKLSNIGNGIRVSLQVNYMNADTKAYLVYRKLSSENTYPLTCIAEHGVYNADNWSFEDKRADLVSESQYTYIVKSYPNRNVISNEERIVFRRTQSVPPTIEFKRVAYPNKVQFWIQCKGNDAKRIVRYKIYKNGYKIIEKPAIPSGKVYFADNRVIRLRSYTYAIVAYDMNNKIVTYRTDKVKIPSASLIRSEYRTIGFVQ